MQGLLWYLLLFLNIAKKYILKTMKYDKIYIDIEYQL